MKARKILLVFLIFYVGHIQAQEIQDSVKSISDKGIPYWNHPVEITKKR